MLQTGSFSAFFPVPDRAVWKDSPSHQWGPHFFMTVTLLQTADPVFYYPMLLETSQTIRELCRRHGLQYEQYVGIKRGHMPWQATYNRVYMLKEMIDRGVEGWAFYLDADAFVRDLSFDVRTYFEERSEAAAIFAGYCNGETPYDINAGGFAINLSHPLGKALALDWYRTVASVPDEVFDGAIDWQYDLANDQHLLWGVLRDYVEDKQLAQHVIFERSNESYVNNGPFVSQHLRSMYTGYSDRLAAIKTEVAGILEQQAVARSQEGSGIFIPARHPRIVTGAGRKTSYGIESAGVCGGLLFGPYIRVPAGEYLARVYGRTRAPAIGTQLSFSADVATNQGATILASRDYRLEQPIEGLISEVEFTLAEESFDLEVRIIMTEPNAMMHIDAVQVLPVGEAASVASRP